MKSAANKKVRLFSVALLLIAACGAVAWQTAWAACSDEQVFGMIVEERSAAQISRRRGAPGASRTWERTYGGSGHDFANAIVRAAGGGFLLAGGTTSTGDGGYDAWAIRLDEDGNKLWERTFGGSGTEFANAVVPAPGGGFLLAGGTMPKDARGYDPWAIRLDGKGDKIWERTFGGSDNDEAQAVVIAPGGGFLLAGSTSSWGAGRADAWAIRLDGNGNTLWKRTFGGKNYDVVETAVAVTGEVGGFLLAGYTMSKGAGGADAWAIRLDGNGNTLWERTFGGKQYDYARAVVAVPGGGFLMVGNTASIGAGWDDAWAFRLDGNGNLLWERTFGGSSADYTMAVVRAPGGGFILAGSTLSRSAGKDDAWVIRVDGKGGKLWERTFGGSEHDRANAVVGAPGGGFLLAGSTLSKGAGGYDAWVLKLDDEGRLE